MVAVMFPKCGAESHPSCKNAEFDPERKQYVLRYPVSNKELRQSKKAQRQWAEMKVAHIKSWGVDATLLDLAHEDGSEAVLADLKNRVTHDAPIEIRYEGRKHVIWRDQCNHRDDIYIVRQGSNVTRQPLNAVLHMISLCEV